MSLVQPLSRPTSLLAGAQVRAGGLGSEAKASPEEAKLLGKLEESIVYLDNDRHFIVNYGDRYRHGEPIASGFVESAVNQVVSKRFVKRQQMAWNTRSRARRIADSMPSANRRP
ncbi:hypothetical protein [Cupriavidus sp. Agwp_2]|uniref:hypothetical protein n=1 Tax=Cupriavidus sp. Agwp_2 TaxID=2897324 RepID=UPI0035E43060